MQMYANAHTCTNLHTVAHICTDLQRYEHTSPQASTEKHKRCAKNNIVIFVNVCTMYLYLYLNMYLYLYLYMNMYMYLYMYIIMYLYMSALARRSPPATQKDGLKKMYRIFKKLLDILNNM